MATTSGAAAPVRPVPDAGPAPRVGARRRLWSLVRSVEAYLAGRDRVAPPSPVAPPAPAPPFGSARSSRSSRLDGLDEAAVTLSSSVEIARSRPRPVPRDKPVTVAHYRALAMQVADERQRAAIGPDAGGSFTVLMQGGARRG